MAKLIALLKIRTSSRLEYRADLLVGFIADLSMSALGIILIFALFSHVDTIAGWDRGASLWLWGMAECTSGITQCLFNGVMVANRDYLINGGLDRLLLRPAHPLVQLISERISLIGFSNFVIGVVMMILGQIEHPVLFSSMVYLPLMILGGVALMGGMLMTMSALGFIAHHTGTFSGLLMQSASFSRYPLTIFPNPIRVLLLPVGLLAYLPIGSILGYDGLENWQFIQPVIGLVVFGLAISWWNRLSKMYKSTGH